MRDILLTAFIFGTIPFILRNPYYGLLMWVWVGIMNPHRFTWGFAYSMPFAAVVALVTLVSMLLNKKKLHEFPGDPVVYLMIFFVIWLGVSPLFSFHIDEEWEPWARAVKIQFMVLVAFLLVGTRDQLHKLVWVLVLSIGFFAIKGGVFTILGGGATRVYGPMGSFIQENNALGLATIMMLPLLRYLQLQSENIWIKRGCIAALGVSLFSILGSYSRGALLALIGMGSFLWLKSRKKALIVLLVVMMIPAVFVFMPESWTSRMATIQTYEEDRSAMYRINAWWMAWNLAVDRFPIGGGFSVASPDVFARYAPDPTVSLTAHSIYFQILGEHGFVGLFLFLMIFGLSWRNGTWILQKVKNRNDLLWARDLAAMCQVSLAGYAVGGAFLSLTYFDLPYYIVFLLVTTKQVVNKALISSADEPSPKTISLAKA